MNDRSEWDDPKNRPPCTATENPFRELYVPDDFDGAADPHDASDLAFTKCPPIEKYRRRMVLVCDVCGHLYFAVKGRWRCPFCGDGEDRKPSYKSGTRPLRGAW